MKAIKDMWLVQIEITNSCFMECPNCTRFVGHNKKPYFMNLEVARKAIDSLQGFPGGVGIMGGEPTLHPQFFEICKMLQRRVPKAKRYIWTSGYNWNKYRSIIRQTFAENVYFNDHTGTEQKHQPVLMAIEDMIDDRRLMKELIDKCWIQERWSASINPKGGFFCEVAAAMDILFEGPGGYPVEKGWWDKTPQQFQDQVQRYCYKCGIALPMPPRLNKEGVDYVSFNNYKRLEELKSPKFLKNCVRLVDERYSKAEVEEFARDWQPWDYLGDQKRISYEKLYGSPLGFVIKLHKKINKKCKKLQRCFSKTADCG